MGCAVINSREFPLGCRQTVFYGIKCSFLAVVFSAIFRYPPNMSTSPEGRRYIQRGRGRGRGSAIRGTWRGNSKASLRMEPPSPKKGSVLAKVYEDDLADDSSIEASKTVISECTEVASFNLLNQKEPTIFVPG